MRMALEVNRDTHFFLPGARGPLGAEFIPCFFLGGVTVWPRGAWPVGRGAGKWRGLSAWRSACFSGADLGRLRNHSIAMGTAHNELQWGKLLWTHLWIDHMYYFAKRWRFLSKICYFAMEGSHRRLKRMLRKSGGLSLLLGRLGVQVVVDSHTIDDSLWSHGWDATKRAQNGQGPISVQTYASRTRRRLLTNMQHLHTLQRRFQCRKKWT